MQRLSVSKGSLKSLINIPASKSYANRALIVAAITKKSPKIYNLPKSTDVINLINALKKIGLQTEEKDGFHFVNSFPECESANQVIQIGDGGTTARFIAVLLLLGRQSYQLVLGGGLKDRPWDEYIRLAKNLGAKADLIGNILSIQGPAKFPESIAVDCSKTTQFATAFSLIEPYTKMKVSPVNMTSSQSYWKMTDKVISDIASGDAYQVPKDWSSASYPLAFGSLNQEIFFPGLFYDPLQADAKFFQILQELKCVTENEDGTTVRKTSENKSFKIEVSDCLDLVPTLGFFLSHLHGHHELTGIHNLVHKESDRLSEIIKLLKSFQKHAFVVGDTLHIEGTSSLTQSQKTLVMPEDHRMVMAGTLFLLHNNGGTVSPQEAVNKSYPDFFSILSP